MSLYTRKDSKKFWIKIIIEIPGKRPLRVQESTGTTDKVAAQEYHDRRKAELWAQARLGQKPRYTWEDAVCEFLKQTAHKRDHKGDIDRLKWLDQFLGGLYLDDINKQVIDKIKHAKRNRSAGTVNRYLATIRTILRKAEREWDWIDKAVHIRLLPEPSKRIRWITHEEADRLLKALPSHLSEIAAFALSTGLRQGNILGLEWSQIDMQRHVAWIHGDQAKGKRDIFVPLNEDALSVLRRQLGKHQQFVFTYQGDRLQGVDNETWKRALKKAGLTDFRFHDLRHSWASWHVMAGTSLQELMELGGWREIRMVLRYGHLSGDHLKKVAGNVTLPATLGLRSEPELKFIKGGKLSK